MNFRTATSVVWLLTATILPFDALFAQPLQDGLGVAYKSPPAPALELNGIDGEHFDLAALDGRVVVINFWATWCPPCVAEMPSIQRMWKRLHGLGLDVLAVNVGEDTSRIENFLENFHPRLEFPILLDPEGVAFNTWNISGLPKTYVVGKKGRIIYEATGGREMDSEHIQGLLRELLER